MLTSGGVAVSTNVRRKSGPMRGPPKDTPSKMGRPKLFHERAMARLVAGTLARMEAVMESGEDRTSFLRTAIEREIERREAEAR